MKDIAIGILILIVCAIIGDFIYTEKNTCNINKAGYAAEERKCGLLKENFDIELDLFNRLW